MRGISDTIARMASAAKQGAFATGHEPTRLRPLEDFGANPGALKAYVHIPDGLGANFPLVVILHGCTQSAAGYDRASGWSQLADEQGFGLLYAEQQRANNPNGCFNWFESGDTRRGSGEALSIHQMIEAVQQRYAIDPARIFVTGLSAGGAMTSTMLAVYPELFAGGAVIAGLPHGAASGMVQAFDRMRGHGLPSPAALHKALRDASDHIGPWPKLSVWHGDADTTVSIDNAEAVLAQWRAVHGLAEEPTAVDRISGASHRVWKGADGETLVEAFIIPGMGHGTPLDTVGEGAYGQAGPYMLDVGISSTFRIAQFWGIAQAGAPRADQAHEAVAEPGGAPVAIDGRRLQGRRIEPDAVPGAAGVTKVIEDALRAAGLMK